MTVVLRFAAWILMLLLIGVLSAFVYFLSHGAFDASVFFYRYLVLLLVSSAVYVAVKRYNRGKILMLQPLSPQSQGNVGWLACFIVFGLVAGGALSLFLSTAWVSLDSWGMFPRNTVSERFFAAWSVYLSHVSRSGEFILRFMGISENQWQTYMVTPLVCLLIPCAMFRLIKERNTPLLSQKGFLFFLFSFLLLLLTSNIRKHMFGNFSQLPIAANYLWPVPVILYFLSCFKKGGMLNAEGLSCAAYVKRVFIFMVGMFSCWGPECVCVLIVPILTLWGMFMMWRKEKIAESCLWGYLGALWGAFLLFASPALQHRALLGCASRNIDFGSMSSYELDRYFQAHNVTIDVADFCDCTGCVNFSDLPLYYHLYFIPGMSLAFWGCAQLIIGVFALLLVLHALKRYSERGRIILFSLMLAGSGYVCASSYLMSCLPTSASYHPPIIIVALAAAMLFYHLPYKLLPQIMLIVGMAGYILYVLAPVGIEQWNYKRYETERFAEIHRQQQEGEEYIVLPHPSVNLPDSFGMLAQHQLEEGFDGYPNTAAAKRYGVKGLRQKKQGEE